jgi:hypothetical protein
MYLAPLNRLLVAVIACGLLLQGCRSVFRVTSEEPVLKKLRRASDDGKPSNQFFALPNACNGRPLIATPVNSPSSLATSTVQIASPTHYLSVEPDVAPFWHRALLMEPEETGTKPAARLTSVFGAREWGQYFGEVGAEPPLPLDIDEILNSACPFWPGKRVKDTHLLVLIPVTVAGNPFSFNLLGELIRSSQGGGYSTGYDYYDSDVQEQLGDRAPERSYWVLVTRDVLEGSRGEGYASQQALVAQHASRTGFSYGLPGALEVATAILSHYVHSGERLYTDNPGTWTRCQELVVWSDGSYPVVVGSFSSGGLDIFHDDLIFQYCGVASLRRF